MAVVLVTGASGLIGSETARYFHAKGFQVVGIDNNMREYFFGKDGSVHWNTKTLQRNLKNFTFFDVDIRDDQAIENIFKRYEKSIQLIVHTAAQPSHDWAAKEPMTDFSVNAMGTLVLLEATRKWCPEAVFIFTSTNKVYGDKPNQLPLIELDTRWELNPDHHFHEFGIDESMSIDQTTHSLFGVSKASADLLVQEYGRYFQMKTAVFRGGCLTGPAHSGVELHGFLAYLVRCAVQGNSYKVFGHKAKQVRDNIHSADLVKAFWYFYQKPRVAEVYNIGGSRHSNCSMIEAIEITEGLCGKRLDYEYIDVPRVGDHIWWVSDVSKFREHYPDWSFEYGLERTIGEIIEALKS